MKYKIIGNRGVLIESTPFLLDELKPLILEFESDISCENHLIRLTSRSNKTLTQPLVDNKAKISAHRLSEGIWDVELFKKQEDIIVDKVICTPIEIKSIASISSALMCYPEIDSIIARLSELEEQIFEINEWMHNVKNLIHEHKKIL